MLESFNKHIDKNFSFLKESKLLIAISGGLDSVALAQLCHSSNLNFSLAHCNFKLRNEESDADEAFVLKYAEDLNVELFIEHFDTEAYAMYNKVSIQMAARELRYDWFYKLADHLEFDYILTAHHADDSLETFLINLSRGTGLEGLTGIPEVNKAIVRPLLPFSRDTLIAYAKDTKLNWREDSSNASTRYLRNALRHDVIPKLKALNPQFLENFKRTQEYLQESSTIIEDRLDVVSKDILEYRSDGMYISIDKLLQLNNPRAYLYQLLKDFGFTQWEAIFNLITAQSGKYTVSHPHRVIKDRDYLIVCSNGKVSSEKVFINEDVSEISLDIGQLKISETNVIKQTHKNCVYIDRDKIEFPLVLRRWKEGDLFYPSGMRGSKKLSKYFKDEKLSLVEKENVWLLCSDNAIIWVLGMREDRRYSATKSTERILKIEQL